MLTLNHCAILLDATASDYTFHLNYQATDLAYPAGAEQQIQRLWEEALSRKQPDTLLFNGKLFNVNALKVEAQSVQLGLCNTNYQQYLATRQQSFRQRYPNAPLANPLAVCIALTTNDHYILVERRQHTDTYSDCYHVIGGFIDPDLDVLDAQGVNPKHAIEREVHEELHLDVFNQVNSILGLVYDNLNPHPEICFQHALQLSLQAVQAQLASKTPSEVKEVIGVANTPDALADFLFAHQQDIAVTGYGCLLLHGKKTFGTDWFAQFKR